MGLKEVQSVGSLHPSRTTASNTGGVASGARTGCACERSAVKSVQVGVGRDGAWCVPYRSNTEGSACHQVA